jgi:hypothetical protein
MKILITSLTNIRLALAITLLALSAIPLAIVLVAIALIIITFVPGAVFYLRQIFAH